MPTGASERRAANLWWPVRPRRRQPVARSRTATGSFGSGPANQSPELVARNLPVESGCQTADLGPGRVPTQRRPPQARSGYLEAVARAELRCICVGAQYWTGPRL